MTVFLTPSGGDAEAGWCEQAAAELRGLSRTAAAFADGVHDGWLGDCEEGRGWARLLQEKSVGAHSLRWLLERHAANLLTVADQFRCTTTTYGDADRMVMGRQWPRE